MIVAIVAVLVYVLKTRRDGKDLDLPMAEPYQAADAPFPRGHKSVGTTAASTATGDKSHEALQFKSAVPVGVSAGVMGVWGDRAIQKARIPLADVQLGQELSCGAYGVVFMGTYNGKTVAVKRLVPQRSDDMEEIENFLAEAKLMATFKHERIVRLVGVAWDALRDLCVVSEFMDGGDLRQLLDEYDAVNHPKGFDSSKLKIAVHVAHALSYLHGLRPSVVHRDLKSKNVLLTRELDAKLTDFGVSRERKRINTLMTANVGTSLWMAPEVMLGDRYDNKADLFSFGVVLSELDTHQLPYAHATERNSTHPLPEAAILQMVSQGELTVAFSEEADKDLVTIARACMATNPHDRPTASDVLHRLHFIWGRYTNPQ